MDAASAPSAPAASSAQSARPGFCHCPVSSWRALRYALGLRQRDMAEMLGLALSSVADLERASGRAGRGHRCPRDIHVERLRDYLRLPELRKRLERAGHPHPFPDDV